MSLFSSFPFFVSYLGYFFLGYAFRVFSLIADIQGFPHGYQAHFSNPPGSPVTFLGVAFQGFQAQIWIKHPWKRKGNYRETVLGLPQILGIITGSAFKVYPCKTRNSEGWIPMGFGTESQEWDKESTDSASGRSQCFCSWRTRMLPFFPGFEA